MKSQLAILALAISTLAYTQDRPTGGNYNRPPKNGPDVTKLDAGAFITPTDSADAVVSIVAANMIICGQDKNVNYQVSHIKDIYPLLQALQFKNVLDDWKNLNSTSYANNSCETESSTLSPKIRCLLMGTEEALYHFVGHKESKAYLEKESIKKEDASVMVDFLRGINEKMREERKADPARYQKMLNQSLIKAQSKKIEKIEN